MLRGVTQEIVLSSVLFSVRIGEVMG